MSRSRWVWLLSAAGLAGVLAVLLTMLLTSGSVAERYAASISVDGYRKTTTEVVSDVTTVTFWVGPASSAPDESVSIPGLRWSAEAYPPHYIASNYVSIDSASGSKWYGNIDTSEHQCSAFIDRLVLTGRAVRPSEIARWGISDADAAGIERGESALLAVGVTCWS